MGTVCGGGLVQACSTLGGSPALPGGRGGGEEGGGQAGGQADWGPLPGGMIQWTDMVWLYWLAW